MQSLISNPLAEASPLSLQELFDRDPLLLTSEDSDRIVTELRAQRDRWHVAEKKKANKPSPMATKQLSLDDLDIKL